MAKTVEDKTQLALSVYAPKKNLGSIDAREKVYLEEGETMSLDILNSIPCPYPHLQVHAHRQFKDDSGMTTETCEGIYEVTGMKIKLDGIVRTEVTGFQQVYSATSGNSADYRPEGVHRNMVYLCTDNGKVLLNGKEFGGGAQTNVLDYIEVCNSNNN
jgi:hypothetical protein